MLEKLFYKIDKNEECVNPCPYKEGEYIGSVICTAYCAYNYGDAFNEETCQGYVICDGADKETK